jgi:hypothetical protein
MTLLSYVPKPNKSVVLISTEHHSGEIGPGLTNTVQQKPSLLLAYNANKGTLFVISTNLFFFSKLTIKTGGVDTFDKIISSFSSKRRTNRWPINSFCFLIDSAAYNAFVLYSLKLPARVATDSKRQRRESIQVIALGLILPYVRIRNLEFASKNYSHVKNSVLDSIEKVGVRVFKRVRDEDEQEENEQEDNEQEDNEQEDNEQENNEQEDNEVQQVNKKVRKNCQICKPTLKRTKVECFVCKNGICPKHRHVVCKDCAAN